jgi:hypothetical protein
MNVLVNIAEIQGSTYTRSHDSIVQLLPDAKCEALRIEVSTEELRCLLLAVWARY